MRKQLFTLILLVAALCSSRYLHAQEPPATDTKGVTPVASSANRPVKTTYAVVVGISDYQDPLIPDLRFANRDAEAFANFLRSPAGGSLDADHLKVLINKDATMAQFAVALDWLWEVCQEDDEAIIYFSGHGDVEKKSLTQPGFLLCWDAPAKVYMAGGAFALPMLQEVISTLSTQNKSKVIVITDACHSGKLSGSEIYGAQLTGQNLARQYANEIKILSCQPQEVSIEGEQWGGGRGAFSFYLVNALYGLADGNQDLTVTLQEVGRYLEDHVTVEVAPISQVPIVIGNRNIQLATVDNQLLAAINSGKTNQMQLLSPIDSRGIEDEVLVGLDTTLLELYRLFKKAVQEKVFLEPANACADAYYERLMAEPKLARLHSAMRRNYAAALQDDAQQTMNEWLKSDISQTIGGGTKSKIQNLPVKVFSEKVRSYPRCLERAAELLGKEHYMYATLNARKHFFEGFILGNSNRNPGEELGQKALEAFRKSLQWQADFPAAYWQMSQVFGYQLLEPDSMEFYAKKAMESYPTWVKPYTSLAFNLSQKYKQYDRAKPYLEQALRMDSSSAIVWNSWGVYYNQKKEFESAENAFKRTIQLDSSFADAYNNLGSVYNNARRYAEAEQALKKSIELDSTNTLPFNTLGFLYNNTDRLQEAEQALNKAIELNPANAEAYNNLGITYYYRDEYPKAEKEFLKAIELDSTFTIAISNLGAVYKLMQRFSEAEKYLKNALQLDSNAWQARANLSIVYNKQRRWEEAAAMAQRTLDQVPRIASLWDILGNARAHLPAQVDQARPALEKALELSPDYPDTYIHLAQLALKNNQPDEAWRYFEQGLEKGIGDGQLTREELLSEPDFEEMRKDDRWNALVKKHLPEHPKD